MWSTNLFRQDSSAVRGCLCLRWSMKVAVILTVMALKAFIVLGSNHIIFHVCACLFDRLL